MVFVLPTGTDIGSSVGYTGPVTDISIVRVNRKGHEMVIEKRGAAKIPVQNSGELKDEFTNHWSVSCDKE